jgi:hypothetical protein
VGCREVSEPSRGTRVATLRRQASAICPSGLLLSKLCRSWSKSAWARLKAKVCWAEARTLLVSASEVSCVSGFQSSGAAVRAACQMASSAAWWGPSKGRIMVGTVFKATWASAAHERPDTRPSIPWAPGTHNPQPPRRNSRRSWVLAVGEAVKSSAMKSRAALRMRSAADLTSASTMSPSEVPGGARQVHKSWDERFVEEEEPVLECERVLLQETEEDTYFGGNALAVAGRFLRVTHRAACGHDALGLVLQTVTTSGLSGRRLVVPVCPALPRGDGQTNRSRPSGHLMKGRPDTRSSSHRAHIVMYGKRVCVCMHHVCAL